MISTTKMRLDFDGLVIEYEVVIPRNKTPLRKPVGLKEKIESEKKKITAEISDFEKEIEEYNKGIEKYTNKADKYDYIVAVASGAIAAVIDSLWVGEFSFERGKVWSTDKINEHVKKVAKSKGYKGDSLEGAIKHLEEKFPVPSDSIWSGKDVGISAKSHHLDDLSHHPSLIGLFFSILTQFTKKGYFQNSGGSFLPIDIDESGEGLIGSDIPTKIFCGTVNWFFHLVSDMAGSNQTAGAGMGIPGPIISLLKEISTLPGFRKSGLAIQLKKAFVDQGFDLRGEMAIAHELGRQAVPVIINEIVVRSFYFIRHLVIEMKDKKKLQSVEWKNVLPWNNRTIARMLTISTGTFTALDITDAAVRAGIKSGGEPVTFISNMILRVNFVGVGRFALAVGVDISMGLKKEKLRNERIRTNNRILHLMNARTFYSNAEMWIAAAETEVSLFELQKTMIGSFAKAHQLWEESRKDIKSIEIKKIQSKNAGLIEEMHEAIR